MLVALFDEMAQNLEFYAITIIYVPDTSVLITIILCLNDFRPSICDTRLTSYTVSLFLEVACCSIEKFNVLSYFFSKIFIYVCLSK